MPVKTVIQLRRDTAADWDAAPSLLGRGILYEGEIGFELDTYRFKIGDGTTPWPDLDYFGASGVIGSGIGGAGTANYLPIFTNGVTVGNSVLYQDTNDVVIGGTNASAKLHVVGDFYPASGILDNTLSAGNSGQILSSTSNGLEWIDNTGGGSGNIDGSGTANYITIWQDNDTITDSIIYQSGTNIGIGTSTPNYKLQVNGTTRVDGAFSAVSKSFRIPHPSKENGELVYGSLESPYHGIRLTGKGKTQNGKCLVHLPYYIKDLVHSENYAIQITNFKHSKALFVNEVDISKNTFTIKVSRPKAGEELEFFWDFTAERKDIEKLQVEQ
jgi:hypothetical protein